MNHLLESLRVGKFHVSGEGALEWHSRKSGVVSLDISVKFELPFEELVQGV